MTTAPSRCGSCAGNDSHVGRVARHQRYNLNEDKLASCSFPSDLSLNAITETSTRAPVSSTASATPGSRWWRSGRSASSGWREPAGLDDRLRGLPVRGRELFAFQPHRQGRPGRRFWLRGGVNSNYFTGVSVRNGLGGRTVSGLTAWAPTTTPLTTSSRSTTATAASTWGRLVAKHLLPHLHRGQPWRGAYAADGLQWEPLLRVVLSNNINQLTVQGDDNVFIDLLTTSAAGADSASRVPPVNFQPVTAAYNADAVHLDGATNTVMNQIVVIGSGTDGSTSPAARTTR